MKLPMHRYVAMIAAAALSLLLLRPACDILALQLQGSQAPSALLLHHGSGAHAERGAAFQAGSHGSSLTAVASAAKGLLPDVAPMGPALAVPALVVFFRVTAPNAAPPPPPRSYYVRSARILR